MNPNDLLLIALLPKPADLARAHEGWYRVPLAHAPPGLARAKALALYQPTSFEGARWQVSWWGALRSVETLRRRDLLPDEPAHPRAEELYACVRLEPLVAVVPPKRATKGRRLLFVPTTWGAFQAAETLDELIVRPHPIADDPLYQLIQQQLADKQGIPDPDATFQKRLFELDAAEYDALEW